MSGTRGGPNWGVPLTFALLACLGCSNALGAQIAVGRNVQVTIERGTLAHSEPTIAAHPTDASRLLAGVISDLGSQGGVKSVAYVSADSGRTWRLTLEPKTGSDVDPTVAFSATGSAFFSALPLGGIGGSVYRSADGGLTWEAPTSVPRAYRRDRSWLTVDATGGRFQGRVYLSSRLDPRLAFDSLGSFPARGLSISTDDGKTFGNPVLRLGTYSWDPNTAGYHVVLSELIGNSNSVVLSDGTVVWAYARQKPDEELRLTSTTDRTAEYRPLSRANYTLDLIGSSDGGETVMPAHQITDIWFNFARSRTSGPHIAADPGSTHFKDRLYVVWADFRNNRLEVMLVSSSDRGRTWTSPITLSDAPSAADPLINGPDAIQPAVAVNKDGVVAVTWYDRRESSDNLAWHYRMRASLDGGDTWLPSVRVSEKPNTVGAGERWDIRGGFAPGRRADDPLSLNGFLQPAGSFRDPGDNTGLVADAAGMFHPIWIDNRTGVRQFWTASVRVERTAAPNGGGELADLRDLGSRVRLETEMVADPATGRVNVTATLQNMSRTDTLRGPVKVRLLDLSTQVAASVEAVNAENRITGTGAVWDFTSTIPSTGLAPGAVSRAVSMEFRLSGIRPSFRQGPDLRIGVVSMRARVLGTSPQP